MGSVLVVWIWNNIQKNKTLHLSLLRLKGTHTNIHIIKIYNTQEVYFYDPNLKWFDPTTFHNNFMSSLEFFLTKHMQCVYCFTTMLYII